MKIIFLFIVFFSLKILNAQTFMGINIGGTQESIKTKLINKGFKLNKVEPNGTYIYNGKLNGDNIIFGVFSTPKSKKVFKFIITFEDILHTWDDINSDFDKRNNILINKYGLPSLKTKIFQSPYKEGDGQELSALQSDKLEFCNCWIPFQDYKNLVILLTVSKYKMVELHYSNAENSLLAEKEQDIINKETY